PGGGQAIHLISWCRLTRARPPTRTLQLCQGLSDALVEAIFDDAQRQGFLQRQTLGALDLHQIAAIEESLPLTGIVIDVQARNTVMAGLLEPLDPPGPAKAGVLQDQCVGWHEAHYLWHERHLRGEAGS